MAATTWRLRELTGASPTSLSLTRIQLLNGATDVTTGATITCTHAVGGSPLAALVDGSGTCVFDLGTVALPGFALIITLPSAVDADAINIQGDGVYRYTLDYLAAGSWTVASLKAQTSAIGMPNLFTVATTTLVTAASQVSSLNITSGGTLTVATVAGGVSLTAATNSVMARVTPMQTNGFVNKAEVRFKITADPQTRRHFGLWLYDPTNPTYGYRVAAIDGLMTLSYFAGTVGAGGETETQSITMPGGALALNTNYTLRVEIGADRKVTVYLNGTSLGTYPNPLQITPGLRAAGVFAYVGTTELYEVDAWSTVAYSPERQMRRLSAARMTSAAQPPAQGLATVYGYRIQRPLDIENGGQGRVYGTVARKNTPTNVPLVRRVRLHRSIDGYLARETWSKPDGTYEFRDINPRYEYDAVAWDNEMSYRSVVANNLKPEV